MSSRGLRFRLGSSLFGSFVGIAGFFIGENAHADTPCANAVSGFSHHVPFDVQNAASKTLTNYAALVTVDTATLIGDGKLQADGGDLRFTDAACNVLDAWVERGLGTASTKIWVKVPNVPAGVSTFYMHSGSADATRDNDASTIFGTGLVALYTFNDASGSTVADPISGLDLEVSGSLAWTPGFRPGTYALKNFAEGRAKRTSSFPQLGTADFAVFTVAYEETLATSNEGLVGTYAGPTSSGWVLRANQSDVAPFAPGTLRLVTTDGTTSCESSLGNLSASTWSSIGAARVGGAHSGFVDGIAGAGGCTDDARDVVTGATGPWELGRAEGGTQAFAGSLAFTAVFGAGKSAAEMKALHDSLGIGLDVTIAEGASLGKPGAPTIVQATPAAGKVVLDFRPPASNDATSYTATCAPGDLTATGTSSPLTVTGLTNGTTYTCSVKAANDIGEGPASSAVSVVPGSRPDAPTNVEASVRGANATVSFTAPSSSGGAIDRYTLACPERGLVQDADASPIELTDLVPATYTCTVAAKNAAGVGVRSEPVTFVIAGAGNPDLGDGQGDEPTTTGTQVTATNDDSGCSVSPKGTGKGLFGTTLLAGLTALVLTVKRRRRS